MFATGLGPVAISTLGLSTMLIAIPTGVKIFNWLGTVYGAAVKLTAAMLFSLGFVAMFTLGGLSGVLHSIVPADTQQTDTYFVVAHSTTCSSAASCSGSSRASTSGGPRSSAAC